MCSSKIHTHIYICIYPKIITCAKGLQLLRVTMALVPGSMSADVHVQCSFPPRKLKQQWFSVKKNESYKRDMRSSGLGAKTQHWAPSCQTHIYICYI